MLQMRPDPSKPVRFKEDGLATDPKQDARIVDIELSLNAAIALDESQRVFVWGRKMGVYPSVEMNVQSIVYKIGYPMVKEINQNVPRLVKSNLVFHKISRVFGCFHNFALVTDKNELMITGLSDFGQLVLSDCLYDKENIQKVLLFFPEFMMLDFFASHDILDVAIGSCTMHVLCKNRQSGATQLFGWGSNKYGQLGETEDDDEFHVHYTPIDMSGLLQNLQGESDPTEILKVKSGERHTLLLTSKGDVFGIGK
mmetsp:Transcript_18084/g.30861  ORF Transcript_18084/g.30861 Transcript_18084/m.30861 type:complete len:254 (+) Transcript_18084:2154-2915(+)